MDENKNSVAKAISVFWVMLFNKGNKAFVFA